MVEKLYRSHSLEKSAEGTSGSITVWEDSPVSPFDVGDTFKPVTNGPSLTVDKVSIKDNVIGELNGRPVRQWQITIEGSNETSSSEEPQTHVRYNFNISADEKSGTMEVVNSGKNPSVTLNIGDTFSVPGVGEVTCSNVRGSDDYDENGTHSWTVTYEGTDTPEKELPEVKYSFAIESDDEDNPIHSGTVQVVNEGEAPAFDFGIGHEINVPGIGKVKCTKINGSDEHTENGTHIWTVTYEGSDATDEEETLPETKYSLAIQKDNNGDIQKSGSMSVVNEGDFPPLRISVGSKFNVPGLGDVTCSKVSANDDYSENGTHRWTITYEGVIDDDNPDEDTSKNSKYSFSLEMDNSGEVIHSGSVEITSSGNTPTIAHSVGGKISLPGVGEVTCTKVSGSDSYSDTGKRKWMIVYEGSDKSQLENDKGKYTLNIEKNSDGLTVYSGSKEITCTGKTPTISVSVGEKFSLPLVGELTCTRVHSSNNNADSWSILIEGSRTSIDSLPETETVINYEINGTTVRSVAGEFIALRRSATPITKKSITVYTDTAASVASPGSTYKGGIVISENIVKETIKNNGVVISSYYKHTIEVEA